MYSTRPQKWLKRKGLKTITKKSIIILITLLLLGTAGSGISYYIFRSPLRSNIERAAENERWHEALEKESEHLGFRCVLSSEDDNCEALIRRARKSERLKEVFLKAQESGVTIYPGEHFAVGSGYITVDVAASDPEIIDFLTKKH